MRYHLLATDYDGTLATDGRVDESTIDALRRLAASGRILALVTGRELEDLQRVFPQLELFERVVAENGALLYNPRTRETRPLGPAPDRRFVERLRARGVDPLSVGHVIVATWEPHEKAVLEAIRDLGLELQVIFNKGAVMVLPAGMTKASGLAAALDDLRLSFHNAVGIGDAENDHAFISACEASVAVANALPALKERADLVTEGDHGAGVMQLVDRLLANDLADLAPRLARHRIPLGRSGDRELSVEPYGQDLLVAGPSGSGKSTLVAGLLERFDAAGYQYCLIDPEGDYESLESAVVLGDATRAPTPDEALRVLTKPADSLVLNLLAIPLDDRPAFFQELLPALQDLRSRLGHPHWLVVDEAHHMLPASWRTAAESLPQPLEATLLITVHPDRVAPSALRAVDIVLAVGPEPQATIEAFARGLEADGGRQPRVPSVERDAAEAALWWAPWRDEPPSSFEILPSHEERHRHRRKYAQGALPAERSFYFRGPEGKLNLRAQNLEVFVQLAEGIDDGTWRHHLERGDYSRWMREFIKDQDLADRVAEVERSDGSADETKRAVREVIEERYTAPA